jgi:hypothetical protein
MVPDDVTTDEQMNWKGFGKYQRLIEVYAGTYLPGGPEVHCKTLSQYSWCPSQDMKLERYFYISPFICSECHPDSSGSVHIQIPQDPL